MDQSRWVPGRVRPWLSGPWFTALLVVVAFAILGAVFMLTSDRKDGTYWTGYSDGQRWVDDGGYRAREESIAAYCHASAAHHPDPVRFEHGCVDGARNALR